LFKNIARKPLPKISKIWTFYFFVKVGYLFFAHFVVASVTRLGDTSRYFTGPTAWRSDWFYNSTTMMDSFTSWFGKISGPYLGNLPFLVLSFVGVYYPISKMKLSKKQLYLLIIMLSVPSFGVWTSIASKEAVGVFYLGMILAGYIDIYERREIRGKFVFSLAVYLLLVFKPQYAIGVFALFAFTWLGRKFRFNGGVKFLSFALAVILGALALYFARDVIDSLSKIMPTHFSMEAGSTRENTIWVDKYDFFKNAAYGMYISFVGPTLSEALSKPTHMAAWIESMFVISFFIYLSLKYLLVSMRVSKINVMFLCGFSLCTFWILFVHYPFGALNPGSAIRYRESFYAFLVCLFFFMYKNAMLSFLQKNEAGSR
jgi:hypothetical protein